MNLRPLGVCILGVCVLPIPTPSAQSQGVQSVPTPPPVVSAVGSEWFQRGAPVLFAGDLYYRAGARFHFDPGVMVPAGSLDGVPIYVDTSVQPYSEILIPVGGGLMQPYERRREGELAGTSGSHTPSFPTDRVPWEAERSTSSLGQLARPSPDEPAPGSQWTRERQDLSRVEEREADRDRRDLLEPPGRIETIRTPEDNRGIWITYEGQRWSIAGQAVPFDASRFRQIGEYHGFPVYAASGAEEVFIPAAPGMLAVYRKDR